MVNILYMGFHAISGEYPIKIVPFPHMVSKRWFFGISSPNVCMTGLRWGSHGRSLMASTFSLRTRRMEEIWPPAHVRRHVTFQHGFLNFVWQLIVITAIVISKVF